jgi:type I restriction enzyme S subunit
MKPYPQYKDSGIDWLGQIPEHWEVIPLKHCVSLINQKIDAKEADLPYLGLEHIESWTGKRIEDDAAQSEGSATLFCEGDVLFGKLRPYLAKVYKASMPGMCTTEALVLRPSKFQSSFLRSLLATKGYIDIINSSTYGAKMPRANWDFIGNLPVINPPLPEQQAIARFLDEKTEQIDALIAKKERLLQLLAEKRTALITRAVTKGLNADAPMKDSGIPWLGEIPAHWEALALKRLLSIPMTDGPHETPEILDEGVPFISAESIRNRKIDFNRKRGYISWEDHQRYSKKYKPKKGDIYIVKSGATTGKVAMVETDMEFNIWSPLAVVRPDCTKADPAYLFHYIDSSIFKILIELKWNYGTQQNIGMSILENLPVILPPLDEQIFIAKYINSELKNITPLEKDVKASISKLKEYRSSMITHAVTGKIDVREYAHQTAVL